MHNVLHCLQADKILIAEKKRIKQPETEEIL